MNTFDFSSLARVNQQAASCSAVIREQPEYFQVAELLPFEPEGEGNHVWLQIQKRGINTDWLAGELAKFASVKPIAVGYAGLKDRHAVTTQWFSINMEGHAERNWPDFETQDIKVVQQTRHNKKLKRGVLAGNLFTLRLTQLNGEKAIWLKSLEKVKADGVPNYFAEQRFGHKLNNLNKAQNWFKTGRVPKKRNQKSIILSSARSWLFNLVLNERIKLDNWNKAVSGDLMLLAGTKASSFTVNEVDDIIEKRIAEHDIHPMAVMWGRGSAENQTQSLAIESDVLSGWKTWQQGLENASLEKSYRSLRLIVDDLSWQFIDDYSLQVSFKLPAGCYATAVLREVTNVVDAHIGTIMTMRESQIITKD